MAQTPWSRLTAKGRARLKKSGVNPSSYNAYEKKSSAEKKKVNRADFIRGKTAQQQRKKAQRGRDQTRRQKVTDRLVRMMGGGKKRIADGVKMMSAEDLEFAETADRDAIVERASEPPEPGKKRNPFWYH